MTIDNIKNCVYCLCDIVPDKITDIQFTEKYLSFKINGKPSVKYELQVILEDWNDAFETMILALSTRSIY